MAALSLVPRTIRIRGVTLASDLLAAWRVTHLTRAQVHEQVLAAQELFRDLESWSLFLAGHPAEALARERARRAADPTHKNLTMAVFLWAVEGADAALAAIPAERAWLEKQLTPHRNRWGELRHEVEQRARTVEMILDVNEAFFAIQTDRVDLHPLADARSRRALKSEPTNSAAIRTRGLVDLHLGHVDRGLDLLRRAWRMGEERWAAALCACYLGYGHALRGKAARSRRFLRRAGRLDARCTLLPRYTRLAEAALHSVGR